jgi:hypothetical protein
MISGVHEHGCGFEAQNEAWYRFLIQPDPFDSIGRQPNDLTRATLDGIDATILRQRADFLRSDSLVVVVVVTDENEEATDPLTLAGQGWIAANTSFPNSPTNAMPQGSIECSKLDPNNPTMTGPNDPNCASCALLPHGTADFATRCPPDGVSGTSGFLDPSDDQLNVRFFHQKERFGVFTGYPTSRYVRGLTNATVPNIPNEHDNSGNYWGDQDLHAACRNPLFSQNLPTDASGELCNLTPGPRTPDRVYYAAIAGVPHQLLQARPGDPECPAGTDARNCKQKGVLSAADWTLIAGRDPEHYDFRGADFHMIESWDPRTTNTGGWANASSCPPSSTNECDPINGREWTTNKADLQFACIFQLIAPKDCTLQQYRGACDCAPAALNSGTQLCDMETPTLQRYGKAYPSVREMIIAHAMSQQNAAAGGQGIVSSLCPIHVVEETPGDPLFGFRPAMDAIVSRIGPALR